MQKLRQHRKDDIAITEAAVELIVSVQAVELSN